MKIVWTMLAWMVVWTLAEAQSVWQNTTGDRIALVIGNADYEYIKKLANSVHDAEDTAGKLKNMGFKVTLLKDAKQGEIEAAVLNFKRALMGKTYEAGLFYYAGHGMDVGGKNYLLPKEIDIAGVDDILTQGVSVDKVVGSMNSAGKQINIVILDACRTVFEGGVALDLSRDVAEGMAQVTLPQPKEQAGGSIVVYATLPGKKSKDGSGRNGVFTESLLSQMEISGLEISKLVMMVRNDVRKKTGDEQIPYENNTKCREFYFKKPVLPPNQGTGEVEKTLAELEASEKWAKYMDTMKQDYEKLEEKDKSKYLSPEKKASAWTIFITTYGVDNPYSREDEAMKSHAVERKEYWQKEEKRIKAAEAEKKLLEEAAEVEKRRLEEEARMCRLAIQIECQKEVSEGSVFQCKVKVSNVGKALAREVYLRAYIPEGIKYQGKEDTSLRWNMGDIQAGEEKEAECTLESGKAGQYEIVSQGFLKGREGSLATGRCSVKVSNQLNVKRPESEDVLGTVIRYSDDRRYQVLLTGIIRDTKNNLDWYVGQNKDITYDEAKKWIDGLSIGNSKWRMPTVEELRGLYEGGKGSRNIDPIFNITGWWVWCYDDSNSSSAPYFLFRFGIAGRSARDSSYYYRVFGVRGVKAKGIVKPEGGYGLPVKVWDKCKYQHNGEWILDMTTDIWCRLSVAEQQNYAAMYQKGYAEAKSLDVEKTITIFGTPFTFRLIPPGRFWMGSLEKDIEKWKKDYSWVEAETRHRVVISKAFYIGTTEVTQRQWQAVMGSNPSFFQKAGADAPVERVSWDDCQGFFIKTGLQFLTEAQWEYACRSGVTREYYWGDEIDGNYCWYNTSNSGWTTHPVKEKSPNAWGLYDMSGNVEEWCKDSADWNSKVITDTYVEGTVDPVNTKGSRHLARGGSWYSDPVHCRSALHSCVVTGNRDNRLGFRPLGQF